MSSDTDNNDPDGDADVADKAMRDRYTFLRLRTRRRMAIVAFVQFVAGGAMIVIGGLLLPSWAERIDHMGTFLSIYFTSLAGVVSMYWGLGAYERSSYGGLGGYGGYGEFTTTTSSARLVKTPRAAG